MTIDAILLASFGGPEGPDEVMPFLERVTEGRGVPRERLEIVAEHYLALGGVSPINAQNRELLVHLREELDRRGIDLPVYWGNRNSTPFFADALRQVHADGRRRVVALTTSAYPSYSGCRQYRENLAAALAEVDLADTVDVVAIPPYAQRPGFAAPFRRALLATLEGDRDMRADTARETQVLFTTHSIPESMATASGPDADRPDGRPGRYEQWHLDVASRIMDGLDLPWRLVFQSRSGPPQVPWLGPDINDAVREAAANGVHRTVVIPIGFISDHVEVIWDLDNEATATAADLGIELVRLPTPGVDPAFVSTLADAIGDALEGRHPDAGWCSTTCCRNARGDLPAVPGTSTAV